MEDFVHLHVHTHYSVLDGQSKVRYLVDKAIKDGMKGMAITDHGVMYGIKELFDYCSVVNKKRVKEGLEPFKPILGCEMYVAHHNKEDKVKENGDASGYHLIVLAKNYQGYKNLIKIVSRSWVDGYYYKPRTDRADLEKYHEGLIVCSACIAGEVPAKVLDGDLEGAREACQWYHRAVSYTHLDVYKRQGEFAALLGGYGLLRQDVLRVGGALFGSWCGGHGHVGGSVNGRELRLQRVQYVLGRPRLGCHGHGLAYLL